MRQGDLAKELGISPKLLATIRKEIGLPELDQSKHRNISVYGKMEVPEDEKRDRKLKSGRKYYYKVLREIKEGKREVPAYMKGKNPATERAVKPKTEKKHTQSMQKAPKPQVKKYEKAPERNDDEWTWVRLDAKTLVQRRREPLQNPQNYI
jgi:hypothetical protein